MVLLLFDTKSASVFCCTDESCISARFSDKTCYGVKQKNLFEWKHQKLLQTDRIKHQTSTVKSQTIHTKQTRSDLLRV